MPITTFWVDKNSHVVCGSKITLDGFTDGFWSAYNGMTFDVINVGSTFIGDSLNGDYVDFDFNPALSTTHFKASINLDSSASPRNYYPDLSGIFTGTPTLSVSYGPITSDIEYRDFTNCCADYIGTCFGISTHNKLLTFLDIDPVGLPTQPYFRNVAETWNDVQKLINSGSPYSNRVYDTGYRNYGGAASLYVNLSGILITNSYPTDPDALNGYLMATNPTPFITNINRILLRLGNTNVSLDVPNDPFDIQLYEDIKLINQPRTNFPPFAPTPFPTKFGPFTYNIPLRNYVTNGKTLCYKTANLGPGGTPIRFTPTNILMSLLYPSPPNGPSVGDTFIPVMVDIDTVPLRSGFFPPTPTDDANYFTNGFNLPNGDNIGGFPPYFFYPSLPLPVADRLTGLMQENTFSGLIDPSLTGGRKIGYFRLASFLMLDHYNFPIMKYTVGSI